MNNEPDPFSQYAISSALQEEGAQQQRELYAPQLQEQMAASQAAVIAQTDPRKVVTDLLMEFSGKERIEGNIEQVRSPTMNSLGIGRLAILLRPIVNDSVRYARLLEPKIRKLTLKIIDDITIDLGQHWREYGIKDRSICDYIVDAILITVYSMLTRAEDQNEKNWLGRISFEQIGNRQQGIQKKGDSWIDKFKL